MDEQLAIVAQVLDALGTAWTIHGLYPDPERQPAFQRSLELIREAASEPVHFEVRSGGFSLDDEAIEISREGAERLARRLFLHGVEGMRVARPPRHEEVIQFFEVLARDEDEVLRGGGMEAAMLRAGVEAFSVRERVALTEVAQKEAVERDESVTRVLEYETDPAGFAQALTEEAGDDPSVLAELFFERYGDVYERVAEDDVSGREEVVRVFVEAFFYLDDRFQVAVAGRFLVSKDSAVHQVFLDQFAGHELARLAPRLDPQGFSLLLDYAQISTDQADIRPDELRGLLESEKDVQEARKAVAAAMQPRMADVEEGAAAAGESFENIRAQLPDPNQFFYKALEVFRALLEVEDRPHRFERLLRIWIGKITGAVRKHQFRRAELWLRAGIDRPTYSAERAAEVDEALEQLATPEVLGMLIGELSEGREGEAQARLLQSIGTQAVDSLVELLGSEEEPSRRRSLMELLTLAAQRDPAPVVEHLNDERWYVVRNLASVLGRIGKQEASAALVGLLRHADHRVRVEALRALVSTLGLGGSVPHLRTGLEDHDRRVRQTALGLLGAGGHDEQAVGALIEALDSSRLEPKEKRRLVTFLAESPSAEARRALTRLAERRFVISSGKRLLRDASREALAEEREKV